MRGGRRLPSVYRRAQASLIAIAVVMGGLAVSAAAALHRPLADPEGFLGPSWLRLPLLLCGAFLMDMLPRVLWAAKLNPGRTVELFRERVHHHWTRERLTLMVLGVVCFYVTYVSYRNLKSFLPSLIQAKYDRELHMVDRALFFGHEPSVLLHDLLGRDWAAHFLSAIYLWFLPLVPLALTAWLIWSRKISYGYWFAVSQCIAWSLGTASYYLLPTLGPGFEYAWLYADLADTGSSDLMAALLRARNVVYWNSSPVAGAIQSVAGFASLHCAITLLVALLTQATLKSRPLQYLLWVNFCLTVVATVYFGWHYVADDVAGVVIALVSFYVGGVATGQHFDRHRLTSSPPVHEPNAP